MILISESRVNEQTSQPPAALHYRGALYPRCVIDGGQGGGEGCLCVEGSALLLLALTLNYGRNNIVKHIRGPGGWTARDTHTCIFKAPAHTRILQRPWTHGRANTRRHANAHASIRTQTHTRIFQQPSTHAHAHTQTHTSIDTKCMPIH